MSEVLNLKRPFSELMFEPSSDTHELGIILITIHPGMVEVAEKLCAGCVLNIVRVSQHLHCECWGIEENATATAYVEGEYGAYNFALNARCMVLYGDGREIV